MRLGFGIGSNPCADANQIVSVYAAFPVAFRVSPYGVSVGGGGATNSVVPYLIDPATLEIEWREDLLIGPFSDRVQFAVALDDSTMVFQVVGPPSGGSFTSRLRVLTRSGITIAMGALQQSVLTSQPVTVIRLDSTHFLRSYTEPSPSLAVVVQVFSVSGSTISLVASTTLAFGPHTVTRDGGEAGTPTVVIGNPLAPLHYDGAGTLHCLSTANLRIDAVPFSIAGGIDPIGLSWRSRNAPSISGNTVGKEGSSEMLLRRTTDTRIGFYDDGSQMHYATSEPPGIKAGEFGERDGETSFGDYLVAHVFEFPPGTPVTDEPASLISQSGTSLSYAPIEVVVLCPAVTGTEIDGTAGPTRHDTALGAVSQLVSATEYLLWAFRW